PLKASHRPSLIMVSTNSTPPILTPPRRYCACGAMLMDSWPPATTISEAPLTSAWYPSATERRPEPQSWLTPQAGLSTGMPAAMEAWRAGFWPCAAVRIWPMMTSETRPGSMPARSRAALMATAPIVGRHGGEGTVETSDRGAGGADDDDIV